MPDAFPQHEVTPRPISLADWAALPEDEPGEVVDGWLVESEVPGYVHELIVMWLGQVLRNWGVPRGALVAGSGSKFAIGPDRGRMPDVTVFLPGAARPPSQGLIHVPPSIAVEVVTKAPRDARRDRVEKLLDYARFGVPWYWILDPGLRTLEIFERGSEGRYVHRVAVHEGTIDPVPGCEGLVLDLAALWREIDALDP